MEYALKLAILIGVYTILATSLNLLAGRTGLLSVAQAAIFGLGAYMAAFLSLKTTLPYPLSLLVCVLAGALSGAVMGLLTSRIRDDYFVIATMAFQIVASTIFKNWIAFTGGSAGIGDIPSPAAAGFVASSKPAHLLLVAVVCLLSILFARRILKSPFGRALLLVREDEVLTQATGRSPALLRTTVLAVAGGMAAVAGSLFAHQAGFIDPTSFTLTASIFILSMVIIGGADSLWGPPVGAAILILLPELLKFIAFPASAADDIRKVLYGILLVLCVMWRPQGLLGSYSLRKANSTK